MQKEKPDPSKNPCRLHQRMALPASDLKTSNLKAVPFDHAELKMLLADDAQDELKKELVDLLPIHNNTAVTCKPQAGTKEAMKSFEMRRTIPENITCASDKSRRHSLIR